MTLPKYIVISELSDKQHYVGQRRIGSLTYLKIATTKTASAAEHIVKGLLFFDDHNPKLPVASSEHTLENDNLPPGIEALRVASERPKRKIT